MDKESLPWSSLTRLRIVVLSVYNSVAPEIEWAGFQTKKKRYKIEKSLRCRFLADPQPTMAMGKNRKEKVILF